MSEKLKYIIIFLVVFTLTGCQEESTDGANYYAICSQEVKFTIKIKTDSGIDLGAAIQKCLGDTVISEKTYHKYVTTFTNEGGKHEEVQYFRIDDEGTHIINNEFFQFGEYLEVKFPLKVGLKWSHNSPYGNFQSEIISKGKCVVNDKIFEDCYSVFTKRNGGGYATMVLAPNTGLIFVKVSGPDAEFEMVYNN